MIIALYPVLNFFRKIGISTTMEISAPMEMNPI